MTRGVLPLPLPPGAWPNVSTMGSTKASVFPQPVLQTLHSVSEPYTYSKFSRATPPAARLQMTSKPKLHRLLAGCKLRKHSISTRATATFWYKDGRKGSICVAAQTKSRVTSKKSEAELACSDLSHHSSYKSSLGVPHTDKVV